MYHHGVDIVLVFLSSALHSVVCFVRCGWLTGHHQQFLLRIKLLFPITWQSNCNDHRHRFFPLRLPTVHPFVHRACCPSAHHQQWWQQLRGLADYYTFLVLFVYHHHYPRHHHRRRCLWIAKGMRTGLKIHTKGDGATTTGGQWNNNEEGEGKQEAAQQHSFEE